MLPYFSSEQFNKGTVIIITILQVKKLSHGGILCHASLVMLTFTLLTSAKIEFKAGSLTPEPVFLKYFLLFCVERMWQPGATLPF